MERSSSSSNQAATVGGIVLVGLGVVFLAQQAIGFDLGHYGWPIFVILPGLALLAAFALAPAISILAGLYLLLRRRAQPISGA